MSERSVRLLLPMDAACAVVVVVGWADRRVIFEKFHVEMVLHAIYATREREDTFSVGQTALS